MFNSARAQKLLFACALYLLAGPRSVPASESASASFRNTRSSLNSGGQRKTGSTFRVDAAIGEMSLTTATASGVFRHRAGLMAGYHYPAKVTDLWSSSGTVAGAVYLQWTAPGNDGDENTTAGAFVIKYSSAAGESPALSEAKFNAAASVVLPPAPAIRGTRQTAEVTGLSAGVTYYFAIKTAERDGARSALSAGTTAQSADAFGCAAIRNVNQAAGPFTTIQSAVDSLPASLSGHSCVIVRDGATYPEQVTVKNFTNNGSSITIMADPASGLRPRVSPDNATSTAAFQIANSSVNIFGIDVVADQNMPYGVWASSGYVQISSVNVSTSGSSGIYTAGIRISSWSAVSYSSVTVWNAHGLWLDSTSQKNAVSYSTFQAKSASLYAMYLNGASSNTFTVVLASNAAGGSAARLDSNARFNVISLSSMVAIGGGSALVLNNAHSNTVEDSYAWGPAGYGARLDAGSSDNAISRSTMVSGGGGQSGLVIDSGNGNRVTGSYMMGQAGLGAYLLNSSAYNTILQSTMVSNSATGYGFYIGAAPSSNTVTGSYIQNLAGGYGAVLDGDYNTISQSTVVANSTSNHALYVNAADRNTVMDSLLRNPTGHAVFLTGSKYNTILRSTMTSAATVASRYALYVLQSSSNTILDSYIQSASSAVYISGSTGTVIGGTVVVATNTAGRALTFEGGSVNLTLATSTLLSPAQGRGLELSEGSAGTVSLGSVTFMGSGRGIEISTQTDGFVLDIDSVTFRGLASGATAIHFLGGTFVSTINLANFEDANIGANVSGAALELDSKITMNAHYGTLTGEDFDNDPNDLVDWNGYAPYPGCAVTKNVGAGQAFPTISLAVAHLKNNNDPLPAGESCIVIRDGATYPEQVTVANFTGNAAGSSITIRADVGFRPRVSPNNATSTAAFQIANSSVNLFGIDIVADQNMPYGVWASSAYVNISSVNVSTSGSSGIYMAGIRISSWSAVSYSSVTVWNAHGLWLDGSTRTMVSYSSAQAQGSSKYALYLQAASSNSFTVFLASNSLGTAVYLEAGSNGNAISQSMLVSNSASNWALHLSFASSNTFTGNFMRNRAGAVNLDNSDYNAISLSTMTSAIGSPTVLTSNNIAYNSITRSHISYLAASGGGGRGVQLSGHDNTISFSTIAMQTSGGEGIRVMVGSYGNRITQSRLSSNGNSVYFRQGALHNTVDLSTIVSNGAGYAALYIENLSSGNLVTQSYISNPAGTGATLDFGSLSNTISFSTITSNSSSYAALRLYTSSGNVIADDFISNPLGHGAWIDTDSNYNTISQSTMVSAASVASRYALYITASSSNTILGSYVQGSNASYVSNSKYTIIRGGVFVATGTTGGALTFAGGSVNLTVATTTLRGGVSGRGLLLDVNNGGTVAVGSVTVTGSARGLEISTQSAGFVLSIDSITFRDLTANATAIHFLGGTFVSSISLANFEDTTIGANVSGAALSTGSKITMLAHSGTRTGEDFDNDPNSLVDWQGQAMYPGCAVTKNVGAGWQFATITLAVDHLKANNDPLPAGESCVVIRDGATYPEQVTVANFTNNGSSITIRADAGVRPTVAPNNAASTAAFQIANSSVNIFGIDVKPTAAASYGVYASSAYVRVSSVNVDSNGTIGYAGVLVSSWSTVDRTSVTVQTGYGIWMVGGVMSTVEYSTANSAGQRALYVYGGSSNTIRAVVAKTAIYGMVIESSHYNSVQLSSGIGSSAGLWVYSSNDNLIDGGYFQGGKGVNLDGSSRNTLTQSVLATNSPLGSALFMNSSANRNTVTGSHVSNSNGHNAATIERAHLNTISQSTITSMAQGLGALYILKSASNTILSSYIQGSSAVFISGSSNTVFGGSMLVATNTTGRALTWADGGMDITIATSTLLSASQGRGLALETGNAGTVSLGSVTFTGSGRAIEISTQAGGFVLSIDSVTFRALASGATAIHFLGGTFVSTINLANFEDANIGVNVFGAALSADSRITMRADSGVKTGSLYENDFADPNGVVDWTREIPPTSPALWFVAQSSIGVQYGTVGADGYAVAASTMQNFSGTVLSSTVFGTQDRLAVLNLDPNTTYYLKAGALWGAATAYAQTVLSTATLASPVSGTQFGGVWLTSATLNWLPLPADVSSNSAQGYVLWASTAADFTGSADISSFTPNVALSTLSIGNLYGGATYYFRVGSLNWNGAPNYALSVSTTLRHVLAISIADGVVDMGTLLMRDDVVISTRDAVTNAGNVRETYSLRATTVTAGSPWQIAAAPGINQFALYTVFNSTEPSLNDFLAGDALGETDATSSASSFTMGPVGGDQTGVAVPVGGVRHLWFRFAMPTGSSTQAQQNIQVTITAEEAP
ncbi:MAG: right-handed parallel beta-helix repeat-containing protein [Elusimicrobia bacterium]|nr:right-handed parallel beta-helix repeat-containing protein [Elusimicrobiota bacterium]